MKTHFINTTTRLACIAGFALTASMANAAIVVNPGNVNAASTYTVTGSLFAIDSPTPVSGGANDAASAGWSATGTIGDSLGNGGISRKAWEPDGTTYSQTNIPWTGGTATYTFNLADGTVINSVFANWAKQGNSGTANVYSYNEGTLTTVTKSQAGAASAGDLVLNWTGTLSDDTTATTYTSNFEQLFSGPITVAGGNGFSLTLTAETGKFPFMDAVVLDVVPEPSAALLGGLGLLALLRRRR